MSVFMDKINDFLLTPICASLTMQRKQYYVGCELLNHLTPTANEYKWVKEKIERILQVIDK